MGLITSTMVLTAATMVWYGTQCREMSHPLQTLALYRTLNQTVNITHHLMASHSLRR
jgi:hypothetical protein